MAHEESLYMIDEPASGKPQLPIPEEINIAEPGSDLSTSQDDVVYIRGARFWFISVA